MTGTSTERYVVLALWAATTLIGAAAIAYLPSVAMAAILLSALCWGPAAIAAYDLFSPLARTDAPEIAPERRISIRRAFASWPATAATLLIGVAATSALILNGHIGLSTYLVGTALFMILSQLVLMDWHYRVVADLHLLALLGLSIAFALTQAHVAYASISSMLGIMLALVVFLISALVSRAVHLGGGIGIGDVYLSIGLGALLGPSVIYALLGATAIQMLWHLVSGLKKCELYSRMPKALPMAPALCVGGYLMWCIGTASLVKNPLVLAFL